MFGRGFLGVFSFQNSLFFQPRCFDEYEAVFEEFPAYGLLLLRLAFNLRTVIVTAAVHRGFGRQL